MLRGLSAGTFLVMRCESDSTSYEAFYVASHGIPMSFIISRTADGWAKSDDPFSFPSLNDLVRHYQDAGYFTNAFSEASKTAPAGAAPAVATTTAPLAAVPIASTPKKSSGIGTPATAAPAAAPVTVTPGNEFVAAIGPLVSKDTDLSTKKKAAKELASLLTTKETATIEYLSTEVPSRQLVAAVMNLGRVTASQ
jgi:hypothetical protein